MKQVRFVVLDLVTKSDAESTDVDDDRGVAAVQALRDTVLVCLRELGHYIAAFSSDHTPSAPSSTSAPWHSNPCLFLSIVVASAADPAQMLLPPQKFKLQACRAALDELAGLDLSSPRSPDGRAESGNAEAPVGLVADHIRVLKKKNSKAMQEFEFKVSCLSLGCPSVTPKLATSLKTLADADVDVEFICLSSAFPNAPLLREEPRPDDALAELALFLRGLPKCTLIRMQNDSYHLRKTFKKWISVRASKCHIILPVAKGLQQAELRLACDLQPAMLNIHFRSIQICSCCSAPVEHIVQCKHRRTQINDKQITRVLAVGDTICSATAQESNLARSLEFTVTKRIELSTFNEGLLFGQPFLVTASTDTGKDWQSVQRNNQRFVALWSSLRETSQALLVKTIGFPDYQSPLTSHFLLMPNHLRTDASFLLKSVVTEELYLPRYIECQPEPDDEVQDEMEDILDQVPVCDYNPLDHSTLFHTLLDQAPGTRNEPVGSSPHIKPSKARFTRNAQLVRITTDNPSRNATRSTPRSKLPLV